jgi:HK97 family phage major capsid protein
MNAQLTELGGKLESKRTEWMTLYDGFKSVGDAGAKAIGSEDLNKFKALETEVLDLQKEFDALKSVYDAGEANRKALSEGQKITHTVTGGQQGTKAFNLGQTVYADLKAYPQESLRTFAKDYDDYDVIKAFQPEYKTTMTTGANGYPPEVFRDGNVVSAILRPPQLIDYLRMETTTQNSLKWMKETTHTNASASASEGSAVAESAYTWTQQTGEINKFGHYIPVTEEQLEDEPGIRSLIENNLVMGLKRKLDSQITVGDGTGQDLVGFTSLSSVDSQARATGEPVFDTALKAYKGLVVDGRCRPNLFVFHMTDWVEEIGLAKTADGIYINGNPTGGMVKQLWGLPVVWSEALTAGTGLLIDTDYFIVKMRTGIRIAVTDSHSTNFIASTLVFRATVRVGFQSLRDEAACKMTSL